MKAFNLIVCLFSFFSIFNNCYSQTIQEIKSSNKYYWGEGKNETLEQADKMALTDLISQISVQVSHSVKSGWSEENGVDNEFRSSMTKTYSGATLNHTERKVEESENSVTVVRFMPKTRMDEIFNERKQKIFDYVKSANNSFSELRVGDALKYYYWALALLRSHPDCNNIKFAINGNEDLLLTAALDNKINSILSSLNIEIKNIFNEKDGKNFVINVICKNQPVTNFDFTYWTGDTWTSINSTKNGIGNVELSGGAAQSLTNLRLRAEYVYLNNSSIDNELQNVLENTNTPFYKSSEFKIPLNNQQEKQLSLNEGLSINSEIKNELVNENVDITHYENSIKLIKQAILEKNFSSVKQLFTDEGYSMYEKLIAYGNAKILPQNNILKAIKLNGDVIIRSVPMSFSFKKNNRKFVEEVSFSFNSEKKINSLAFTLSDKSINGIMKKRDEFGSAENKYQLLQFMENYKTAYCLGRIDFLEQVFTDNALIIVGNVLKAENTNLDKMYVNLGTKNVNYIKYSKKEYIEKMKSVFRSNEFVNIQFEEDTVKIFHPDKKIYGIQIAQNWYSANYSDKGYLFLMIDLKDSLKPKIYVRTWQPTKNPDGTIYGIESGWSF